MEAMPQHNRPVEDPPRAGARTVKRSLRPCRARSVDAFFRPGTIRNQVLDSLSRKARGLRLAVLVGLAFPCWEPAQANDLSVAVFKADVTPPLGHALCGGWIQALKAIDEPLLAKGILLEDEGNRYVLCAIDWCLLQTGAYDSFRDQVAFAAGAPPRNVSIHTVHQHNAPIADLNAELLLGHTESPPTHLDLAFMESVTARLASAVRDAAMRLEPFSDVGLGKAQVRKFASNRRVPANDGSIRVRYSSTRDPELRAAPEGLIDPWLRTITLYNEDAPLVQLHYYATHPMSFYGDGIATPDAVGLARERRESETGVPQIYFTGCAGNITAGKYNDGSYRARDALTRRIHAAMRESSRSIRKVKVESIEWRTVPVRFHLRSEPEWSEASSRETIRNPLAPPRERLKAALNLAWIERYKIDPHIDLSALKIGPVTSVHLPGEAFVEFQLFAQSLASDDFIAVAAYGESGTGYICTDAAFEEGGYEPTAARVGVPSEGELKRALRELLSASDEFK